MYDPIIINSHKGNYSVYFDENSILSNLDDSVLKTSHFIIDQKLAELYATQLNPILGLSSASVLLIAATEQSKSLESFPNYVNHLIKNKIRKDHKLIAIGGGIIQDITCFLAATMLRGLEWWFYPTTLLAQADSCIGSKSSVNCGQIKNILGTFTPPKNVFIQTQFLQTLEAADLCSGVGEMLKVHAIDGMQNFNEIAHHYESLFSDTSVMLKYIIRSLQIKKQIIEQDEFDSGPRKVMNYGHTFGHAIESASEYKIPHGIAVTIGMDMANYIAEQIGVGGEGYFIKAHEVLKKNYQAYVSFDIPLDSFLTAIAHDKKNTGINTLGLILPNKDNKPTFSYYENNDQFKILCKEYLSYGRSL